ncbi:hypothetical protein M885DRAFT_515322 [Pelagophyceae sp. CCMP2097]|nr:hypothetical protein M885DRAFT_515322 [Pelagophyceae sp. CCMP2097]
MGNVCGAFGASRGHKRRSKRTSIKESKRGDVAAAMSCTPLEEATVGGAAVAGAPFDAADAADAATAVGDDAARNASAARDASGGDGNASGGGGAPAGGVEAPAGEPSRDPRAAAALKIVLDRERRVSQADARASAAAACAAVASAQAQLACARGHLGAARAAALGAAEAHLAAAQSKLASTKKATIALQASFPNDATRAAALQARLRRNVVRVADARDAVTAAKTVRTGAPTLGHAAAMLAARAALQAGPPRAAALTRTRLDATSEAASEAA